MELARKAIKAADKFKKREKKKEFLDLSDEEVLKYHPGVHPDDKRIKGDVRSYQEDFDIKDEDEFFELDKKRKNKLQKKRFGGMAVQGVKENPPIY